MAEETTTTSGSNHDPQQETKTRMVTVLLRFLPDPGKTVDEFGNRFPEKYQPDNLEDLIDSIRLHGLLDPPLLAKGADGTWRIISGHRRVASLYVLVARGALGFSLDMPVPCLEVLDASELEMLIRSIAANELGRRLDVKERLLATKKAHDAGATKKEIAATLGVSEKSIERDLKIVSNPRVLKHVMDDNLPPTTAAALVEVATRENRLDEFLKYFDAWSQLAKEQITEDDRRAKLESGKGLRPNQMQVLSRLEPHLVRGWMDALTKKRPFTEEPDLGFLATFDKKTAVATVKLKVSALNDPVDHLARVAGQVSQVAKHLAAFAQKRRELEAPAGPQAALQQDEGFLDVELLKEFGLADIADQITKELRPKDDTAAEPFGPPKQIREDKK